MVRVKCNLRSKDGDTAYLTSYEYCKDYPGRCTYLSVQLTADVVLLHGRSHGFELSRQLFHRLLYQKCGEAVNKKDKIGSGSRPIPQFGENSLRAVSTTLTESLVYGRTCI